MNFCQIIAEKPACRADLPENPRPADPITDGEKERDAFLRVFARQIVMDKVGFLQFLRRYGIQPGRKFIQGIDIFPRIKNTCSSRIFQKKFPRGILAGFNNDPGSSRRPPPRTTILRRFPD